MHQNGCFAALSTTAVSSATAVVLLLHTSTQHKNPLMPNPRRRERLGALIEEILSDLIRRMKDPRIAGLVSVSRVQVTPDASLARVFISIMGSEDDRRSTMTALERGAGFLRTQLGHELSIRHVPELQFTLDRSIEEGDQVLHLLNQIEIPPAPPDGDSPPLEDDEDDGDSDGGAAGRSGGRSGGRPRRGR
jgi:ribosome-binding factor A